LGSGGGRTSLGPDWVLLSRSTTKAIQQLSMPLSRTVLSGAGMYGGGPRSRRELGSASPEMPLLRMVQRSAVGAGGQIATPVSAWPTFSGPPLDLPLQRAAAGASAGLPARDMPGSMPPGPASEPSSLTTVAASLEGPDLERLAGEVIAIIERRLTIQRESRGF
jgi:hypothetical protein